MRRQELGEFGLDKTPSTSSPERAHDGRKRDDPTPISAVQGRYDATMGLITQKRV